MKIFIGVERDQHSIYSTFNPYKSPTYELMFERDGADMAPIRFKVTEEELGVLRTLIDGALAQYHARILADLPGVTSP